MSGHTPGPWKVMAYGQSVMDSRNEFIASCVPEPRSAVGAAEADANARLIAAAPELLEALAGLVKHYCPPPAISGSKWQNEGHLALVAARDAIRKARGEE